MAVMWQFVCFLLLLQLFSNGCLVISLNPALPIPRGSYLSHSFRSPVCYLAHPCHRLSLCPQEHVEEGRVLRDQPHWQQNQRSVQEHDDGGSDAAVLRPGGGRVWLGESHWRPTCWEPKHSSLSPHGGAKISPRRAFTHRGIKPHFPEWWTQMFHSFF